MKFVRNQWERVRDLGLTVLQRSEQSASRAFQAEAGPSGRTPEYAKLNLPRGRWEGHGPRSERPREHQNRNSPALKAAVNSQNWSSFAMRSLAGLTSGGAMMLMYTHRNDYANTMNGMASMSWGLMKDAGNSIAGLMPQNAPQHNVSPKAFLADAAEKASPAIVNITANFHSDEPACWSDRTCGSGFITDARGLIVTNAHVVESAVSKQQMSEGRTREKPLMVALQDGRQFEAKIVGIDRHSDLALIEIAAPKPLPTVQLGRSAKMRVGEWVLALGSPLTLQNSVTAGIVSCTGRKAEELGLSGSAANYIQTDAAINTGNSGGPLINMNGEVIGVSCMRAICNGVSFAIPIDSALDILKQMEEGDGKIVRPYVGIKMLELNAEIALHMHQKNSKVPPLPKGILVPSVSKGSPADKAGLKAGDIIIGLDDESVPLTVQALTTAFASNIGKRMKLYVRRESQSLLLVVTPCRTDF